MYVDDFNMTGKKQEHGSHVVDLGETTSFLDHVYLGCTQRECKSNRNIVEQYQKMFESLNSAGATEKYKGGRNLT